MRGRKGHLPIRVDSNHLALCREVSVLYRHHQINPDSGTLGTALVILELMEEVADADTTSDNNGRGNKRDRKWSRADVSWLPLRIAPKGGFEPRLPQK